MSVNEVYTSRVRDIGHRFYEAMAGSSLVDQDYLRQLNQVMEKEVYSLLNTDKPRIMVYGIYNSGKSTLVNALMRNQVAEVADRPMTWEIAEYDKGEYVLIDSPGVDAPKEHEQISDGKLRECHVILFVISSKGGFESEANYRKMLELIRMDIPFYIILNDRGFIASRNMTDEQIRQAKIEHAHELEEIRHKILVNLQKYGQDQNIGSRYTVIPLNAKSAWTGVEKSKPKLFQQSGVPELENRISSILNGTGALDWLRTPQKHLQRTISEAETSLMARKGDAAYVEERRILQQKMFNVEESMKGRIQLLVASRRDAAYRMQLGGSDNLPAMLEELQRDVENTCKGELLPLVHYVDERFQDLGISVDGNLSLRYTAPKFDALGMPTFDAAPDESGVTPYSSYSGGGSGLGGTLVDTAIGTGLGGALSGAVGGTALGIGSGIAAGAATGSVVPGIGTLIGAGIGLLKGLISSHRKRREAEEARLMQMQQQVMAENARIEKMASEQMLRRQEARTRADRYLDELEQELRKASTALLNDHFMQITAVLDRAIEERAEMEKNVRSLLNTLRQLRGELDELMIQTA